MRSGAAQCDVVEVENTYLGEVKLSYNNFTSNNLFVLVLAFNYMYIFVGGVHREGQRF